MTAVAVLAGAGTLYGCGLNPTEDVVEERSFTDQHGRACTYVIVQEAEEGYTILEFDAKNIDCDYPPSSSPAGGPR
jgi:hypothetical protein